MKNKKIVTQIVFVIYDFDFPSVIAFPMSKKYDIIIINLHLRQIP